ncbi:hypothetical protein [Streptomyces sp. N35]|uniref:hypothetical protein n=1 Tax=Streptomyces sp. N35 TaxID=2795730 RepID=UPI0018F604A6|nr:hypothetical protein [Streptomyces sp. N35]
MRTTTGRLPEINRQIRGHAFYPPAKTLKAIPALYATEDTPMPDKTVHLHYFATWGDIWITEINPETMEAYGFGMIGHSDPAYGDWGYYDLPAYESLAPDMRRSRWVMERDLHFTPAPARDVLPAGSL